MMTIGILWKITLLQVICTFTLLVGLLVNYLRVIKLREDLLSHRLNLENTLAHIEAEMQAIRQSPPADNQGLQGQRD